MSRLILFSLLLVEALASGQDVWQKDGITFIPNAGQWSGEALFVARKGGMLAVLEQDRLRLNLSSNDADRGGHSLALVFEGTPTGVRVEGLEPGPEAYNFFIGNDPARWKTGLSGFAQVRYRELQPGVDLLWREQGGLLEYDVLVAPGAELSSFVVRVEGVLSLRSGEGNELLMETPAGLIRQTAPVAWQETLNGDRMPLRCRFQLLGDLRYGFEVEGRDPELSLVVDPGLIWSTYLGGASDDFARSVQVNPSGKVFVAGQAQSLMPYASGFGNGGGWDAFAARFYPASPAGAAGQLQWMTYVGGSQDDALQSIDVTDEQPAFGDPGVYFSGWTASSGPAGGFPVTANAFQSTLSGAADGVVVVLDAATGSNLRWSTYLGGSGSDQATKIHTDANGNLTIAGITDSPNLPTTPGAFQPSLAGGRDAFVARFQRLPLISSYQLQYLTYFGGSGDEGIPPPSYLTYTFSNVMVTSYFQESTGMIMVAGCTTSADLPTQSAYQPSRNLGVDGFVCRLDPTQAGTQQLVWGTYLGGSGDDVVTCISLNFDKMVISGYTTSAVFPVTPSSAFQATHASAAAGLPDGFIVRLDLSQPGPAQLDYGTFLGGAGADHIAAVCNDGSPAFYYFTGTTDSVAAAPYFPTTGGAYDTTPRASSGNLAFVAKLNLDATASANPLHYSTWLGGQGGQTGLCIAPDRNGGAVVVGATLSAGVPTTPGSYQPGYAGGVCGWLTWLDLLPTGAARVGSPTPGPSGRPVIGVRSQPRVGNAGFAFTCQGAPPLGVGAFGVSTSLLIPAVQFCGVSVFIDFQDFHFFAVPASAGAGGYSEWEVPLPAIPALAGLSVATQYLWLEPLGGCSGSAALVATIQP